MINKQITLEQLSGLINVAKGFEEADLIIKNGKIINVFNEEIEEGDIAIHKGFIAGIGKYSKSKRIFDANGAYVSPSFIDSHMHIESTMLIPGELALAIAPLGTTAVIADPHEVANVAGIPGIQFMINASKNLPVDFFFLASSCVPATNFETSGATLYAEDLSILKSNGKILGLAEVMNFPAVTSGNQDMLEKILEFQSMIIDGHAPGLTGNDLNAYLSAGIQADHECTEPKEAREKISKGMYIMMREGSVTRDVLRLLPILNDKTKHRILLCTDDKHPEDLLTEGHINYGISILIKNGVPLPLAIRLATLNPSIFFRFIRKGGIAPGYTADLVIFKDILNIGLVMKDGEIIAKEGKPTFTIDIPSHDDAVKNTINLKQVTFENLRIKKSGSKIRVIGLKADSVVTDEIIIEPKVENGFVVSDVKRDLIKIAVFERHRATGNVFCGFLHGLGLKYGAFATSIAHDSHNIIVAGENDKDMLLAIAQLEAMGGGIAIAKDGKVLASLPLPYGGLMTNRHLNEVAHSLKTLHEVVKTHNKVTAKDPFMTLAFMALPVIPKLKITDKGLVDVDKFVFVPLFVED
jgi:adenine deaminase